jgi:hypothetical protein
LLLIIIICSVSTGDETEVIKKNGNSWYQRF